MENIKRYGLSNYKKVDNKGKIPLYCCSIYGIYEIPEKNRIGYYKKNGAMLTAKTDADLRELLAADILEEIGIPHAEIIPVYDEKNSVNGCISVNILDDDEEFISVDDNIVPALSLDDFINRELDDMSNLSNVTPELLEKRRKYVIQYLFLSALLSNADLKRDNIKLIHNVKNGSYRNAEYYDSGIAFVENRTFLEDLYAKDLLVELYKKYPKEIYLLAENVVDKLTPSKVKQIMSNGIYNGFEENTKSDIEKNLNDRVAFISRNNDIIKNKIENEEEISIEEIEEISKDVDISLKMKIKNKLMKLKNKMIKDKDDDKTK